MLLAHPHGGESSWTHIGGLLSGVQLPGPQPFLVFGHSWGGMGTAGRPEGAVWGPDRGCRSREDRAKDKNHRPAWVLQDSWSGGDRTASRAPKAARTGLGCVGKVHICDFLDA